MDWRWLLFSFSGRMRRLHYWLIALANIAVIVAAVLFFALLATVALEPGRQAPLTIALGLAVVVQVWIMLACGVKRLHDRDRSGWWILVFWLLPSVLQSLGQGLTLIETSGVTLAVFSLASLVLTLWAIIELGFLPGTPGDNRFGPDPLSGLAGPVASPPPAAAPPAFGAAPPPSDPTPPTAPPRYDPWRR